MSRLSNPASAGHLRGASQPAIPAATLNRGPPFLVWPVARREYYLAINIAIAPTLLGGLIFFGPVAAVNLLALFAGMLLSYPVLRLYTRRGRGMSFQHALAGTLVAGALTSPLYPWPALLIVGLVIPLLTWLISTPGRHALNLALLAPLVLLALYPLNGQGPLLARNRLLLGNVHHSSSLRSYHWPRAGKRQPADAVTLPVPEQQIQTLYKSIARKPVTFKSRELIHQAFSFYLPSPTELILGAVPGWIGTVSLLAIILGGLYLSYRHILQPGSWLLFLSAVVMGLVFGPLSRGMFVDHFWQSLGGIWYLHGEQAMVLLTYELCSGDFLFASVFVLAFPGSLPMEPNARRFFLLLAGLLAALTHRLALPVPPATFALLVLQPLAPVFDALLHRRSWILQAG